jgi:tRNA(Ile)-lysidine synthase
LNTGKSALQVSENSRKPETAAACATDKPMIFDPPAVLARLRSMVSDEWPSRWLVAFSGGIDSTALLHALVACRSELESQIVAVHIDHGLHRASMRWDDHCRRIAQEFHVDYLSCRIVTPENSGMGVEAAAREARYAAIAGLMQQGDCVLSAHHQDDQAETLLLNLLRGCGLAGMAGIGAKQVFSCGHLLRPLLDVSGREILAYARAHSLAWIDDPSNEDTRFGRNYLRSEVMPLLASRWPAIAAKFSHSAELAGEGNRLLGELADLDLAKHQEAGRLSISALRELSAARQRNVLRRAVELSGLPPAPANSITQAVRDLIPARADAQPLIRWKGAELRRYRDQLFVLQELPDGPHSVARVLSPDGDWLELGDGMGAMQLVRSEDEGIDPRLAGIGLRLKYREGGEEIRLTGHAITHKVKKLMQQEGILPWMRDRLPFLYAGDELVAVADLWIAAGCVARPGLQIRWRQRPAIR